MMVNSALEMESSESKEQDADRLPSLENLTIDPSSHESKEPEHTVHRHIDFSNVKTHDNFAAVEFQAPAAGTPAALALEANAAIKVTKIDKGLHKFRGMKRPKLKSLNIVKKINKTTKSKRDRKHFSTNFKGKVIDGVHELYTLTAGMMLGIRYSIGRNHTTDAPRLDMADFSYVEKVFFPPNGNNEPPHITPRHSLAHTFKFKTYCPKVFQRLRDFFGIDAASYMISVCGDYNFVEFISNSKSGQFFFYSHDGKYMIKTQTKEENKFLKRILPHYYKFLTENPYSMLVQILGMHRVKMYHLRRKVHFVIMRSVFDSPAQINTIYDLKGSLIGRSATEKERASGGVLKDNDLIADKRRIQLGVKKAAFMDQLEKDAMFLASLNIMDYSLLVGFHDRKKRVHPNSVLAANTANNAANCHGVSQDTISSNILKHMSTDSAGVTGRSNTPFRRSIHVTTLPSELDAAHTATLTSATLEHNNAFETPLKQHPPAESPGRRSAKRHSASGELPSAPSTPMAGGGSAKEHRTPVRQTSMRKKMSKSMDASDSSRERGDSQGLEPQGSPSFKSKPSFPADIDVNHSSIDVTLVEGDDDNSPKSFGSMYVNRDNRPTRRFKKTFVRTPNSAANKPLQHHSSVHHLPKNGTNGVKEVDPRRRSTSSSEEYAGRVVNDFILTEGSAGSPERPKRNSRSSNNGGADTEGEDGEECDEGGDEYYYEEEEEEEFEEDEEEEDFDFIDEGDSVLGSPDELDDAADGHESINTVEWAKNIGYSKEHHAIYTRQPVLEDGQGALGPEGGHLGEALRSSIVQKGPDQLQKKKVEYTYGPGATNTKPWTSRKDGGINSRGPAGRGDDIYFVGIIDILQQYNTGKKIETLYKGLTNDSSQISSVDAVSYAKRFVKFMGEHIE